jgi:hypothetical protein
LLLRRSTLSCCDKHGHDGYGTEDIPSLLTNLDIGTCEFTTFKLPPEQGPVETGTKNVVKYATFKATW